MSFKTQEDNQTLDKFNMQRITKRRLKKKKNWKIPSKKIKDQANKPWLEGSHDPNGTLKRYRAWRRP